MAKKKCAHILEFLTLNNLLVLLHSVGLEKSKNARGAVHLANDALPMK
jgi:hypothetical protein